MQTEHMEIRGFSLTTLRLVVMQPFCDSIGIDLEAQRLAHSEDRRFNYQDILTVDGEGKGITVVCLPIEQFFGWLYTIDLNAVNPAVQERLLAYHRECDGVFARTGLANGLLAALMGS